MRTGTPPVKTMKRILVLADGLTGESWPVDASVVHYFETSSCCGRPSTNRSSIPVIPIRVPSWAGVEAFLRSEFLPTLPPLSECSAPTTAATEDNYCFPSVSGVFATGHTASQPNKNESGECRARCCLCLVESTGRSLSAEARVSSNCRGVDSRAFGMANQDISGYTSPSAYITEIIFLFRSELLACTAHGEISVGFPTNVCIQDTVRGEVLPSFKGASHVGISQADATEGRRPFSTTVPDVAVDVFRRWFASSSCACVWRADLSNPWTTEEETLLDAGERQALRAAALLFGDVAFQRFAEGAHEAARLLSASRRHCCMTEKIAERHQLQRKAAVTLAKSLSRQLELSVQWIDAFVGRTRIEARMQECVVSRFDDLLRELSKPVSEWCLKGDRAPNDASISLNSPMVRTASTGTIDSRSTTGMQMHTPQVEQGRCSKATQVLDVGMPSFSRAKPAVFGHGMNQRKPMIPTEFLDIRSVWAFANRLFDDRLSLLDRIGELETAVKSVGKAARQLTERILQTNTPESFELHRLIEEQRLLGKQHSLGFADVVGAMPTPPIAFSQFSVQQLRCIGAAQITSLARLEEIGRIQETHHQRLLQAWRNHCTVHRQALIASLSNKARLRELHNWALLLRDDTERVASGMQQLGRLYALPTALVAATMECRRRLQFRVSYQFAAEVAANALDELQLEEQRRRSLFLQSFADALPERVFWPLKEVAPPRVLVSTPPEMDIDLQNMVDRAVTNTVYRKQYAKLTVASQAYEEAKPHKNRGIDSTMRHTAADEGNICKGTQPISLSQDSLRSDTIKTQQVCVSHDTCVPVGSVDERLENQSIAQRRTSLERDRLIKKHRGRMRYSWPCRQRTCRREVCVTCRACGADGRKCFLRERLLSRVDALPSQTLKRYHFDRRPSEYHHRSHRSVSLNDPVQSIPVRGHHDVKERILELPLRRHHSEHVKECCCRGCLPTTISASAEDGCEQFQRHHIAFRSLDLDEASKNSGPTPHLIESHDTCGQNEAMLRLKVGPLEERTPYLTGVDSCCLRGLYSADLPACRGVRVVGRASSVFDRHTDSIDLCDSVSKLKRPVASRPSSSRTNVPNGDAVLQCKSHESRVGSHGAVLDVEMQGPTTDATVDRNDARSQLCFPPAVFSVVHGEQIKYASVRDIASSTASECGEGIDGSGGGSPRRMLEGKDDSRLMGYQGGCVRRCHQTLDRLHPAAKTVDAPMRLGTVDAFLDGHPAEQIDVPSSEARPSNTFESSSRMSREESRRIGRNSAIPCSTGGEQVDDVGNREQGDGIVADGESYTGCATSKSGPSYLKAMASSLANRLLSSHHRTSKARVREDQDCREMDAQCGRCESPDVSGAHLSLGGVSTLPGLARRMGLHSVLASFTSNIPIVASSDGKAGNFVRNANYREVILAVERRDGESRECRSGHFDRSATDSSTCKVERTGGPFEMLGCNSAVRRDNYVAELAKSCSKSTGADASLFEGIQTRSEGAVKRSDIGSTDAIEPRGRINIDARRDFDGVREDAGSH